MDKRKAGPLEVSAIGMGCMGFSHGYGRIPDEADSIEAIRSALDLGCTFFDTAEVYSPNLEGLGHNERIVGKALKGGRSGVVLATKLFVASGEPERDGSLRQTLRRHLADSLRRLETDWVDIYYLHRVNPDIPVEDVAFEMGRLAEEGLIRGWGLSAVSGETAARAHAVYPLAAVQNLYNMFERGCEEDVFPFCLGHGIAVVAFSPVASGLLSGKITAATKFEEKDDVRNWVPQLARENIQGNQPMLDVVASFARRKQATCAQIALAWMLCKYPNAVPIPGSRNKERIRENLEAWKVQFTPEEFRDLEAALAACTVHGRRGHVETAGSAKRLVEEHEARAGRR